MGVLCGCVEWVCFMGVPCGCTLWVCRCAVLDSRGSVLDSRGSVLDSRGPLLLHSLQLPIVAGNESQRFSAGIQVDGERRITDESHQ